MRLDRQTTPAGSAPIPPGTHMVNRPAPRPERDIKPAPSRGAFLSSSRGRPLRMVVSAQLSHALLDLALIGTGQTVVLALIHERLGIVLPERLTGYLEVGDAPSAWAMFDDTVAYLRESPLFAGVAVMTFEMDALPDVGARICQSLG